MVKETTCNNVESLTEPFRTLISAAILAPSGDNTQPWRFEVDEGESSITVRVDETRDTSPMNSGQCMSRVACGAAVENIVQTAEHNGWEIAIQSDKDPQRIATLYVGNAGGGGSIPERIRLRHTNRRIYDGSALDESLGSKWRETLQGENNVEIAWISERDAIRDIASAIGRADAAMFGNLAFFRAFLSNVRFDLPPHAAVAEGLCLGSLELSAFERAALPTLRHTPDLILRLPPFKRSFQTKAERLVNNSSGLCIIAKKEPATVDNFQIGRTMQRAWLHLTESGFQVQPMMSVPVLVNAYAYANGSAKSLATILGCSAYDTLCGITGCVPSAILRFGRGPNATARTGRRPINHVVERAMPPM
jgi:hypothetical protein